jgi:uncharacterized protein YegP (UPF0339 family)
MHFKLYKDTAGYWRWRLIASNGKIIADSGEGYYNKTDCEHGISLVKSASTAPVYE